MCDHILTLAIPGGKLTFQRHSETTVDESASKGNESTVERKQRGHLDEAVAKDQIDTLSSRPSGPADVKGPPIETNRAAPILSEMAMDMSHAETPAISQRRHTFGSPMRVVE